MAINNSLSFKMRVYHRYLGFFLAGIMAVYSLSGIVLIFRDTDFLKKETKIEQVVAPNASAEALGKAIRIKNLQFEKTEGALMYFKQGVYNAETGEVAYTVKKLPLLLDKMTHLHKAKSADPLFFLNILFGLGLFFFVMSSFWMFAPGTQPFKKGLYFTIGGVILTLLLLFL